MTHRIDHTQPSQLEQGSEEKTRLQTLQAVALVVSLAATPLTLLVYTQSKNAPEALAPAMIALTGWVALLLLKMGFSRLVPHVMVAAILAAAITGILAFGSVRTAATLLVVGAVSGAGIFLGRRALIATVAGSAASLGVFNWAEQAHLMRTPDFSVGLNVWVTQTATLVVVAIMVYYGRVRAWQAYVRQTEELELRKRTELERDRSLERFGRIFQKSPSAMMAQSANSELILDINPAFERCFGHSKSNVVGRSDSFLWADPRERARYMERLVANRRSMQENVIGLRADGSEFDALISSELGDDPEDRLVITTIIDISQERRRQDLLLSMANGLTAPSGDALFAALTMHMAQTIDASLVMVSELTSNQKAHTLSVWKDGAAADNFTYNLEGTPCGHAINQTDLCVTTDDVAGRYPDHPIFAREGYQACVGQALRNEEGVAIGFLSALWRHPVVLTPDTRALIAIFANRATTAMLRVRNKRALEQLNETLEQRVVERTAELRKLNAELDSFAYSISHDLKSPLRAIDGFTQLLSERLDPRLEPEERRLMERILGATHRMANLMADLLALTRISQCEMHLRDVNLSALAHAVSSQLLKTTPRPGLTLRIAPNVVRRCDENLARIALSNLMQNALTYTRDQPHPVIEFGEQSADPDGEGLDLYIQDNGIGFDMAHVDKLFKPFQRLHMPSAGFEGTGIGLATVHRIVERHGGLIKGSGTPHQGARFAFTFSPRAASAPTDIVEKAQIEA